MSRRFTAQRDSMKSTSMNDFGNNQPIITHTAGEVPGLRVAPLHSSVEDLHVLMEAMSCESLDHALDDGQDQSRKDHWEQSGHHEEPEQLLLAEQSPEDTLHTFPPLSPASDQGEDLWEMEMSAEPAAEIVSPVQRVKAPPISDMLSMVNSMLSDVNRSLERLNQQIDHPPPDLRTRLLRNTLKPELSDKLATSLPGNLETCCSDMQILRSDSRCSLVQDI